MTNITFVDANDMVIGAGTKQEAWEKGIAHRIVRIFVFNPRGELLIQKRSESMQSLPGRWDQSAAGHVDEREEYITAAQRELFEEVGVKGVDLVEQGKFYTEETDEVDKIKKRFNMVYTATYDGAVDFDREEVSEVKWIVPSDLHTWMREKPGDFTEGFLQGFDFLQKRFEK